MRFRGLRWIGRHVRPSHASMARAMSDQKAGIPEGIPRRWNAEQATRAMTAGGGPNDARAHRTTPLHAVESRITTPILASTAAFGVTAALLWSISGSLRHDDTACASMGGTTARDRGGPVRSYDGDSMVSKRQAFVAAAAVSTGISSAVSAAAVVRCWGSNEFGQCNVPADVVNPTMVAAGWEHCMAILADGRLRCWGNNDYGQCNVPGDLGPVVEVAGGIWHSVARRADGTMRCWGWNGYGQCNVPSNLGQVIQVQGGLYHSSALRSNGMIWAWGLNDWGQCSVPSDLTGVVRYAGGPYHSIAIRTDGSLVCWGRNSSGQCNIPADVGKTLRVAAGTIHSLALRNDGSVRCWGSIQTTDPALGPAVDVIGGGGTGYIAFAIQADGRARDWTNPMGQPSAPSDLTGVMQAGIGREHFIVMADTCELPSNNLSCCAGDIYRDGVVNGADLGILLSEWGAVTATTHSDLDGNGHVDGADLGLLLSHWGRCGG
jgi:Regulator of chromosome condensation (RCC1) repeat